MYDNQIGDAGCIALAEALKVNTTVTAIDVSACTESLVTHVLVDDIFFSRYQVIENSVCIVTVAEVAMWRGIPVVAVFCSLNNVLYVLSLLLIL